MNMKPCKFKNQQIISSAHQLILLIIITSANLLISLSIMAQPPQKMSYQCVVRDNNGALVTDHLVGMRTTIYQGSLPQLVVYQETYNFTATNANGLLTVEIGGGNPTIVSGQFTSIPWSSGPFFLQTEIDPTGGTNYTIVGKSQILSVPYALYAEKSGTVTETDPVFGASAAKGITWTNFANWNAAYSWGDHTAVGYAMDTHNHSASEITLGTLPAIRGGTGISSYTTGNFLRAGGATTIEQRTPAQVLADIDAVGLSNDQTITGTKIFTGNVFIHEKLNAQNGIHSGMMQITNVANPTESHHAATKGYVDNHVDQALETFIYDSIKSYVIELFKTMGLIPVYYAGTVTDIDGNIYTTVTIVDQTWMAQNLRVTHYNDGSLIPRVHDNASWAGLTSGARIEYGWALSNINIYGLLYNFYAVSDSRKLCPAGWHVPAETEWMTLIDNLGGLDWAGGKLKETGTDHWDSPNYGALDQYGFSALPGGWRLYDGPFTGLRTYGIWWTTQEASVSNAWIKYLEWDNDNIFQNDSPKTVGCSVRCLKD